jgi:hypothetical protein
MLSFRSTPNNLARPYAWRDNVQPGCTTLNSLSTYFPSALIRTEHAGVKTKLPYLLKCGLTGCRVGRVAGLRYSPRRRTRINVYAPRYTYTFTVLPNVSDPQFWNEVSDQLRWLSFPE